ncbi:modulator protein [Lonsdalea britannica]|uniref:Modulator protein n=1 Tax=Lonsdalea britannica TaxID=1082704 RepID=A0AAD0SFH3_9GAMM|nr:EnvZ/OmpR regulon moderator MzrA [Lonsdalea britannica]AXW86882.1 modulator protein [Lonsdalea britannica]OSM96985.1 modulator protein [Lonsdalea britannica]OSN03259.1 modulator protein [Lonsdalea britannica]
MVSRWLKNKPVWRLLLMLLPVIIMVTSSRHTPDEVTLHISPQRQGATLPDGFYIYQRLSERGIGIESIIPAQDSIVVRLSCPEQSRDARDVLRTVLPQVNVVTQIAKSGQPAHKYSPPPSSHLG